MQVQPSCVELFSPFEQRFASIILGVALALLQIGHIERYKACHLSPLLDAGLIRVEGLIPRGSKNMYKMPCHVAVYATAQDASQVRRALSAGGEATPLYTKTIVTPIFSSDGETNALALDRVEPGVNWTNLLQENSGQLKPGPDVSHVITDRMRIWQSEPFFMIPTLVLRKVALKWP